jgi:hypothetical protein
MTTKSGNLDPSGAVVTAGAYGGDTRASESYWLATTVAV